MVIYAIVCLEEPASESIIIEAVIYPVETPRGPLVIETVIYLTNLIDRLSVVDLMVD